MHVEIIIEKACCSYRFHRVPSDTFDQLVVDSKQAVPSATYLSEQKHWAVPVDDWDRLWLFLRERFPSERINIHLKGGAAA